MDVPTTIPSSIAGTEVQVVMTAFKLEIASNFVELANELVKSKREELDNRMKELKRLKGVIEDLQNGLTRAELQRDKAQHFCNEILEQQWMDFEQVAPPTISRCDEEEGTMITERGATSSISSSEEKHEFERSSSLSSEAPEEDPEEIAATLPDEVKGKFGQVMFSLCSKNNIMRPVLLLNPFRVPPGLVQDMWYDIYDEFQRKNQLLDTMPNLVYWYGEAEDPNTMFTMVQSSELIPFDEGVKRGYDRQGSYQEQEGKNQIDKNPKIALGLKYMTDDLKKDPEHRFGPTGLSFLEFDREANANESRRANQHGISNNLGSMICNAMSSTIGKDSDSGGQKRPATADNNWRPNKTVATEQGCCSNLSNSPITA